jgi:hypothetical protein
MFIKVLNDFEKVTSGHEIWSLEIQKCFSVFSKTVKDIDMKFSGMIDFSFAVWDWGLSMSAVISCCHRK